MNDCYADKAAFHTINPNARFQHQEFSHAFAGLLTRNAMKPCFSTVRGDII